MLVLAAVERLAPRRPFGYGIGTRWLGNLGMMLSGYAVGAVLLPPAVWVGSAVWADERSFGVLHAVPLPMPALLVVAVLALDFGMWLQHWLQHRVRPLWRSHRVHHTDLDVDVTTSWRFHPFESIYTTVFGGVAVMLFGLPPEGVLLYELLHFLANTVVHTNLSVPERANAVLTSLLVTPDFHRMHHSADPGELDRNYGSVFSFWDRVFRTLQARPGKGHLDMELGIATHRDPEALHVFRLLAFPFLPVRDR